MLPIVLPLALAGIAVLVISSQFAVEKQIRIQNNSLRKRKLQIHKFSVEIEAVNLKKAESRLRIENLRYDLIMQYCDYQIDFYKQLIVQIQDLRSSISAERHTIWDEINTQKRDYIAPEYWIPFQAAMRRASQLGVDIGVLVYDLKLAKEHFFEIRNTARQARVSNRGSKNLIKEILDESTISNQKIFSRPEARMQIVKVGSIVLNLSKKCSNCRCYCDGSARSCFSCGNLLNEDNQLEFTKAESQSSDFSCSPCGAPLFYNANYCYNCGKHADPFLFRHALNARRLLKNS